jgi:hypothetical protein
MGTAPCQASSKPSKRPSVHEAVVVMRQSSLVLQKLLLDSEFGLEQSSLKKTDERTFVYVTREETQAIQEENLSRDSTLLYQAMQDQIETLKQELAPRNEELRRKDHLLAALTERIPAIESPTTNSSEPRESTVSDSETEAKGAAAVPQDSAEGEIKQSFWRRLFGG